MKTEIKTRQIAFLLVTIAPITKLLSLPAILAHYSGLDAWLTVAIYLAADLVVLFAVLASYRICPDMNYFEILSSALGKPAARVILTLFGLFFLMKSIPPMMDQKYLFTSGLYETMPNFAGTIPFVIAAGYVAYKGLNALARNANLAVWTTGLSFLALFLLAVSSARPDRLLPVLENGTKPIADGLLAVPAWFGDGAVVLAFLGRIQAPKGRIRGVIWGGAAASVITVLFFLLITGIFGNTAVQQLSAIAKIGQFNVIFANLGRGDWPFVILLMLSVFFASSAMLYAATYCLQTAFGVKNPVYVVLALCAALLLLIFFLRDDYIVIYDAMQRAFNYAAFVFQYLLPLLTPVFARIAAAKKEVSYAG